MFTWLKTISIRGILRVLSPFLAPIVERLIKEIMVYGYGEFFKNDAKNAEVTLVSLYPILDVPIENLTHKTGSEIDDAIVDGLLSAHEEVATKQGIPLHNADDD